MSTLTDHDTINENISCRASRPVRMKIQPSSAIMPYNQFARGGKVMSRSRLDRSPPASHPSSINVFTKHFRRTVKTDDKRLVDKLRTGCFFISDEARDDPFIHRYGSTQLLRPLPPEPEAKPEGFVPWKLPRPARPSMDRKSPDDENHSTVTTPRSEIMEPANTTIEPETVEIEKPPMDLTPDDENQSIVTGAQKETKTQDPDINKIPDSDKPTSTSSKKKKKKKKTNTVEIVKPPMDSSNPDGGKQSTDAPAHNETNIEKPSPVAQEFKPESSKSTNSKPTNAHTRAYKVLLRGIPAETTEGEISNFLEKRSISTTKIVQFRKRIGGAYKPLPLFLVILQSLPSPSANIFDVRTFLQSPVKVEWFRGGRGAIQCFNCQGFGHAQSSCHTSPRCMKCAGEHKSYLCPKPKTSPALCCNCGLNHTSNFSGCEARPRRNFRSKPRSPAGPAHKLVSLIQQLKSLLKDEATTKLLSAILQDTEAT